LRLGQTEAPRRTAGELLQLALHPVAALDEKGLQHVLRTAPGGAQLDPLIGVHVQRQCAPAAVAHLVGEGHVVLLKLLTHQTDSGGSSSSAACSRNDTMCSSQ